MPDAPGKTATRPGPLASARFATAMARRPHRALVDIAQLGDVVDVGYGPSRFTFAFGAEANEAILSEQAGRLTWGEVLATLIPVDGPTALVVTDGPDHDRRRKLVQPAFHRRRIDGYVAVMAEEARRLAEGWADGATVEVHEAMRGCIRRIVVRTLFGDQFAEQAQRFGDLLEPALAYVQRPPTARIDRPWFPPYRRAMAARDAADALVYEEIARRRSVLAAGPASEERPGDDDDVLAWLMEAVDGDALDDAELRDQVVSLIAAGYDTTAAAAAWLVHAVWSRPAVLAELRAEAERELPGGAPPDAAALSRMPFLQGVVSESLRLWPPGAMSGRKVHQDVEVCGATIPRGRMLLYSAWVTQRDARWWPEPERFEPGRWIQGHPAHQEVRPGAFVTFGGGARRCIGFAMATTELQVLAVELARAVDLDVPPEPPEPTGLATTVPRGGLPAVVRRRR
ncbi:MAG: cytochrome P450 [Acidimicrobiales bacterium]